MSKRTPILFLAAIAFPAFVAAETPEVIINEVQIQGGSVDDEFIEILNRSAVMIDISGWKIQKKTPSGTASSVKSLKGECVSLPPGTHYLWANSKGTYAPIADATTTASLAKNNVFELLDADGNLRDSLPWGVDAFPDQSLSRDPVTLEWNAPDIPTPTGGAAVCPADEPEENPGPTEPRDVSVRINELFPNPKNENDEWIELFNFGANQVALAGWTIRDTSKTGKYVFGPNDTIIPDGFLVVPRSVSKLSLNNSDETVSLLDPSGRVVDTVSYGKTTEGASYGFSPSGWRWSRTLTPGIPNVFGKAPDTRKESIPKSAYKNVPVTFSAAGNKKDMKYVWDFGDGHKSYKSATTHTYEKTGKYHGMLTVSDGTESDVTKFSITVKKYSAPKVRIVELAPNPEGKDSDNEWLLIENRSKKQVDLLGWSVATGSKKKTLVNHPVRESLVIGPGQKLALTRSYSLFTLPNKRGAIELRSPDGKAVQTISYRRDDGIKENETYRKDQGSPWIWVAPNRERKAEESESAPAEIPDTRKGDSETDEAGKDPGILLQSSDGRELSFDEFVSLGTSVSPTFPEALPRVLGVSDERLPPENGEETPNASLFDTLLTDFNALVSELFY